MIGFPTATRSWMRARNSAGAMSRPDPSSSIMASIAPRTAPVSSATPSGFIITYDTRLIRSSPNRIWGFIVPAPATTSPVARSTR